MRELGHVTFPLCLSVPVSPPCFWCFEIKQKRLEQRPLSPRAGDGAGLTGPATPSLQLVGPDYFLRRPLTGPQDQTSWLLCLSHSVFLCPLQLELCNQTNLIIFNSDSQ